MFKSGKAHSNTAASFGSIDSWHSPYFSWLTDARPMNDILQPRRVANAAASVLSRGLCCCVTSQQRGMQVNR